MNKLEYVARSLSKGTHKKYETYVVNAIYQKINEPNLLIETQKSINLESEDKKAYIDLFLPQLNIAIEVDEGYHANEEQQKRDNMREEYIEEQIQKYCIGNNIQFIRILTYNLSLEELNNRIDDAVSFIKDKIDNRTEKLAWKSQEEQLEEIKNRGCIERNDDCFTSTAEIINCVYGKEYKGWQKGSYGLLWFPWISYIDSNNNLSNRSSWQNFFNKSEDIIYERNVNEGTNQWKKECALNDQKEGSKRVVFVHDKDSFGKRRLRFVGVFKADGWDDNMSSQKWKLVLPKLKIPIDEERIKSL